MISYSERGWEAVFLNSKEQNAQQKKVMLYTTLKFAIVKLLQTEITSQAWISKKLTDKRLVPSPNTFQNKAQQINPDTNFRVWTRDIKDHKLEHLEEIWCQSSWDIILVQAVLGWTCETYQNLTAL